jgi:hypothetical protein
MKPIDTHAASVCFGIEIETSIPNASNVSVGQYHRGIAVQFGRSAVDGAMTEAPRFIATGDRNGGVCWQAERDSSIQYGLGRTGAEFVSPILHSAAGVQNVIDFVAWLKSIGAQVNESCGVHVTVSVDSIIGSSDPQARADFAQKLAHIAQWHSRAIYGQTGTGRHLNTYSRQFHSTVAVHARAMKRNPDLSAKMAAANACGRGMVNFGKLFSGGVVEFRAFAGTLNIHKILHHIATAIGLCRRAHEVKLLGAFTKNKVQQARTRTSRDALLFMHEYLGWRGSKRDCALGLFGPLHTQFRVYRKTALQMCDQFDVRYSDANL